MNFIRENILKILLVVGVLIVLIIVLIACSGSGTTGKASSYPKMEENLKNAATRYLKSHSDLLPTEEGKIVQVQMDSIYTKKQMDKVTAVDDSSVKCDGYVNVSYRLDNNDEKNYRVVPHIKCADKYETEELYMHILKNEDIVTEYDGLYQVGNEYIFKGEEPNNYLQIGNNLYRIMSIDENNYIKIITAKKPYVNTLWDDRYNQNTGKEDGINDYYRSRMREALKKYYIDEDSYSTLEKDVFVKHSICVGKRSESNKEISKTEECSMTMDEDYLSLPILYDFFIASADKNCKTIYDDTCRNYNYLASLTIMPTLTASKENTNLVFEIGDTAMLSKASRNRKAAVVTYITNVIYSSGKGTLESPYIIK
ncbi:MAG: hypothetical protein IKZ96_00200 [Bacilli bacterium]|nr:hypothetical protein [Bacilli bacterium]